MTDAPEDRSEPDEVGPFGEPKTAPHLVLDLEGDHATFEAWPEANQFLLVKYIDDLTLTGYPSLNAVTKLAFGQVKPQEKDRLEAYLEQHGHAEDYSAQLYDALGNCWAGETMLPLVPSPDSSGPTSEVEPTV